MANFAELWPALLAAASALVLLSNAGEKAAKAYRTFKAPNARQDERLDAVEKHLEEVALMVKTCK